MVPYKSFHSLNIFFALSYIKIHFIRILCDWMQSIHKWEEEGKVIDSFYAFVRNENLKLQLIFVFKLPDSIFMKDPFPAVTAVSHFGVCL